MIVQARMRPGAGRRYARTQAGSGVTTVKAVNTAFLFI